MNQFSRSIALWLVLGLMFLLLFNIFSRQQTREPEEIFSDFLNRVEKGEVAEVTIQGNSIHDVTSGSDHYKTYSPTDPDIVKTLRGKGVKIAAKPAEGDPVVDGRAGAMVPDAAAGGSLDFLHAPDADRRRQGDVLWEEPRQAAYREYP